MMLLRGFLPRLGIRIIQINHDFLPVPSKPVLLYMARQKRRRPHGRFITLSRQHGRILVVDGFIGI